ncbi:MAG: serine hydrolase domain-containing protein, partial [Minicystis sp.]
MRLRRINTGLLLFVGFAACTSAPTSERPAPATIPLSATPPLLASTPFPLEPASAAPASSTSSIPPLPVGTLEGIDAIVQGAIAREEVAGAVIAVLRHGEVTLQRAYGARLRGEHPVPMTVDTVFDLASLTKALCTGPAIVALAEQKKLHLGDRVSRYLPAFAAKGKEAITLEELLLHTSGLPADNALSDYDHGREEALSRIEDLPLEADPGARFLYSDLGYIVLGAVIEKVSGQTLDAFAQSQLFGPLGMKDTTFNPGASLAARAAPTETRGNLLLQGQVHDPRAFRLRGVAGHAGLFSTAADLTLFARMLLGGGSLGEARVLSEASVQQMTRPRALPDGGSRGLGWDINTQFSGNRGELKGGFGHTGFTGPSIWIDPS